MLLTAMTRHVCGSVSRAWCTSTCVILGCVPHVIVAIMPLVCQPPYHPSIHPSILPSVRPPAPGQRSLLELGSSTEGYRFYSIRARHDKLCRWRCQNCICHECYEGVRVRG